MSGREYPMTNGFKLPTAAVFSPAGGSSIEAPRPKVLLLLGNLGSPDAPTTSAVRRFLTEFLSDSRVVDMPWFVWQIVLRGFILPFRPARVARAYAGIWGEKDGDAPLRCTVQAQAAALSRRIRQEEERKDVSTPSDLLPYPRKKGSKVELDITVLPVMSYGNPGIRQVLDNAVKEHYDHVLLLPLFPQYSATVSATLYDALADWIKRQRRLPGITVIRDYFAHPLYIEALANSVQRYRAEHGTADKLLMSFHSIPQEYADKGDPYPGRCHVTAARLAAALHLEPHQWGISFQSRFGPKAWVTPYTDSMLREWATGGVASVQIISPGFSADCLETLEELAVENAQMFCQSGGQSCEYIPALNDHPEHIELLFRLVKPHLEAIEQVLVH